MLRFIRRARDMGFVVAEINDLLNLWRDKTRQSGDVKRIAKAHIDQLRERIASLEAMAATLGTLVDCCAGDDRPDCPILADLEDAAGDSASTEPQPPATGQLRNQI